MYTAQICLRKNPNPPSEEEQEASGHYWYGDVDDMLGLLSSLYQNGQIIAGGFDHNYPIYQQDNTLITVVSIIDEDSLADKYHNPHVRKRVAEFGDRLSFQLLSKHPDTYDSCQCEQNSLILFASSTSPLRCGDCHGFVPLYKLRDKLAYSSEMQDIDFYEVLQWCEAYRVCDSLQINCAVGEHFGTQQMSSLKSELSIEGCRIANKLSQLTGIPVYYYLFKYYAKNIEKELKRKCPSCGNEWKLDEPLFELYDFKCEACGLLSNVAFDVR